MKMSIDEYRALQICFGDPSDLMYSDNGVAIFISRHSYDNCEIVAMDEEKNVIIDDEFETPEFLSFDDLIIKRKIQGD